MSQTLRIDPEADQHAADQYEQQRLAALEQYDILDTPQEESFDRITRLTRAVFDVPIATITLIDGHRQWFKSRQGMASCETERAPALCDVAIREARPLVIPDTQLDDRFKNNPFVIGDPHLRFYAGAQLRAPGGLAIGTLCAMDTRPRKFDAAQIAILSDLAALVMSELELRKLAMYDGLTGVLSRRAFRDEGARAIALALRHKHELSCITFDLDHFKSINDHHGHAIGDLVLSACANVCRKELRKVDLVGRVGGEEFAILLPMTGRDAATRVAERIRIAFERLSVVAEAGLVKTSASFGIAPLAHGAVDVDELLLRADSALYLAKEAGRNRCVAWQPADGSQSAVLRRVLKAGKISFNSGHSSIDCTVRGLSDSAASLSVYATAEIPEHFKLAIPADDIHRACHVTERRERHLEVSFD